MVEHFLKQQRDMVSVYWRPDISVVRQTSLLELSVILKFPYFSFLGIASTPIGFSLQNNGKEVITKLGGGDSQGEKNLLKAWLLAVYPL